MIPHPTPHDLIISTEVLFYGLALRYGLRKVATEAVKEKRRIYKHHNKHHGGRLRICRQEDCPKLTRLRTAGQSQADLAAFVPAQELDLS